MQFLVAALVLGVVLYGIHRIPEVRDSRAAESARLRLRRLARHVRDLQAPAPVAVVAAGSPNAMVRAADCLASGNFAEARDLYAVSARGVHAENPQLLLGLARAHCGLADYAATLRTLDLLRMRNPGLVLPEADRLRAQAQNALGGANGESQRRDAA